MALVSTIDEDYVVIYILFIIEAGVVLEFFDYYFQ
jgi:hypothetical protein